MAKAIYDDLVAKHVALNEAKIILAWELKNLQVATTAATAAKAEATAKQTDLKTMEDSAGKDGAGLRARQRSDFFNLFTGDLKKDMDAADAAVVTNQGKITT